MSEFRYNWRETPKGYALRCRGEHAVVFWDQSRQVWRYVYEDTFSGSMPSFAAALDAVEEILHCRGEADRQWCRDVPPQYRHLRSSDVPKPQPISPQEEARRMARARLGQHVRGLHESIRASIRRPPWASVLQLPGSGPWTLEQVRDAYRALARQHHPDRGGNADTMAAVNRAWEVAQRALTPVTT